jgi:hypothetical protein
MRDTLVFFFLLAKCSLQESKALQFLWISIDGFTIYYHITSFPGWQKIVEQQHHVLFLYSYRYFFTKNQMFPRHKHQLLPLSCSCSIILSRLVQKTGIDIFNKALEFVYFNCIFIFVSLIILFYMN